jgi:uncharacterized peroxidase-related enzyme
MRLELFHTKQKLSASLILQIIRFVEGVGTDIVRLFFYRKEYFGEFFQSHVRHVLRGESDWSYGDRELMAAFISSKNRCRYCADAHRAVAAQFVGDGTAAAVVSSPPDTAPVNERLRAMLAFLEKLTLSPRDVGPSDVEPLRRAGISDDAIENAIEVCVHFCIINRLADTFGFRLHTPSELEKEAKLLSTKHYKL